MPATVLPQTRRAAYPGDLFPGGHNIVQATVSGLGNAFMTNLGGVEIKKFLGRFREAAVQAFLAINNDTDLDDGVKRQFHHRGSAARICHELSPLIIQDLRADEEITNRFSITEKSIVLPRRFHPVPQHVFVHLEDKQSGRHWILDASYRQFLKDRSQGKQLEPDLMAIEFNSIESLRTGLFRHGLQPSKWFIWESAIKTPE